MTPSTELSLIATHLSGTDALTAQAIQAIAETVRDMERNNARMRLTLDELYADASETARLMAGAEIVDIRAWSGKS